MGIKGKKHLVRKATGVEQTLNPVDTGASDISAFRIHPEVGGWVCDRGIEPWFDLGGSNSQFTSPGSIQAHLEEEIVSLFVWKQYLLVESGGILRYHRGNKNSGSWDADLVVLDEGRHVPDSNEIGTQYIPFNAGLLIINGTDKPLWFTGDEQVRPFGFTLPTPPPEVLGIQPGYHDSTEDLRQSTGAPFFDEGYLGLGQPGALKETNYSYAITFISDSGSESPLSPVINVGWTAIPEHASDLQLHRFGITISDLPTGPKGTVARRLYRSKNQMLVGDTAFSDASLYLVRTFKDNSTDFYIDVIPDQALVDMREGTNSTEIQNFTYVTGTAWDNRIWLGGGDNHPGRIIYSDQGLPEQIGPLNYIEIEGEITALQPYFNNLIVFKKDGIDIIRERNGIYSASALHPSLGTTATNTIKLVPDVGLVFLSYDGLYTLAGGLDGGSVVKVIKISKAVSKEMKRVGSLARACAVYSKKEKEYWMQYIPKGQSVHSRGVVLHSDAKQWSLRHPQDKDDAYLWAFTSMAVERDGTIILGTRPTWDTDKVPSDSETSGASGYLVGPQVWSAAPFWGKKLLNLGTGGAGQDYSTVAQPRQSSSWESCWLDFGDNSKRYQVHSVELEIVSKGDEELTLEWAYDGDSTWNSAGGQRQVKPERAGSSNSNPVFGPSTGNSKSYFKLDTSTLKDDNLVRLRWDVSTSLVSDFKFKLTGADFHLVGFTIHYDDVDRKPLNQRATRNLSQPW